MGSLPPFMVGDRVMPSDEACRTLLDERSKWMRSSSQWGRADDALQVKRAARGTVTECAPIPTGGAYIAHGFGVKVDWDDGHKSSCLAYMVESSAAADALFASHETFLRNRIE